MRLIPVIATALLAAPAPARQDSGPPLSGPEVVETAQETSLVRHDYMGSVRRLDVPAEVAAVRLLDLDGPTRTAVQDILVRRAALLDNLVLDNIHLLIQLGAAGAADDKKTQAAIATRLFVLAEPLRARGLLRDELAGVLPGPARRQFFDLIDEYKDALIAEHRARGSMKGRLGILAEDRLRILGEEVQRSFARQIDRRGEEQFERLLASLELRPEQESKIRHMAEEFIIGARFRPNPSQQALFIFRVMAMLDEKQRQRLAGHIADEAAREKAMMR